MSGQAIEMHFTEIMDLSGKLREQADAIKNLSETGLMQVIFEIKAGWNSECADILAGKEVKISEGLCQEANRLFQIAEDMEEAARKMYRSELANSQLAIFRSY